MNRPKTRPDEIPLLNNEQIKTPALVWDMDVLDERLASFVKFSGDHGCSLLYSVKASGVGAVMQRIKPQVSGFACSSPFEARLARHVLGTEGSVHITSPALHLDQSVDLDGHCDHVTFNSLTQWRRLGDTFGADMQTGLRINPELSIVSDPRFDPCRKDSKLGVPLSQLIKFYEDDPGAFKAIKGLHVHSACGNRSFRGLKDTVQRVISALPGLLEHIQWFNLGGGYFFDKIRKTVDFTQSVSLLRQDFGLQVFIEPGTAMVRDAASMVSTVVDVIDLGAKKIAVLDTTVNHMPEVFAYQFRPPVKGARRGGKFTYILAGATCLAGDTFGTYAFNQPLEVGQRVIIEKMGAYTHGQSHWFNGVNLPAIYTCSAADGLTLEAAFSYDDFARRCGLR